MVSQQAVAKLSRISQLQVDFSCSLKQSAQVGIVVVHSETQIHEKAFAGPRGLDQNAVLILLNLSGLRMKNTLAFAGAERNSSNVDIW